MKKLISCLLAVALVFSLMGVSVFAGADHPNSDEIVKDTAYSVVGTQGETDTLADGVSNPNGSADADVTISFVGSGAGDGNTIENRYAIDITYNDLIIDLSDVVLDPAGATKKVVWDVNKHYYVPVDESNNPTTDDTGANPLTINAFQITNHSDLPINYMATYAPEANTEALTMALSISVQTPVPAATAGTYDAGNPAATNGTAATGGWETITATPNGTTWLEAINALSAAGIATDAKIGQITVTISQGSNTNP